MKDEDIAQFVKDMLYDGYSNTTFTSQLYEMFGKHTEGMAEYIKEGREFWFYDGDKRDFRKLKVTYVRSGVMFFVFEDEEKEHAWFINSFNCCSLHAAQIYPYEIGKILSRWYEDAAEDFPKICEKCKWGDCNGRIKVEVIWE